MGSRVCAQCHAPISNKYSRTDMGRSMSEITPLCSRKFPTPLQSLTTARSGTSMSTLEDGKLFQSEYEIGEDGKEVFRETQAVDWIIGSGANGFGALLRRSDFLFEAPLSFYSKTQSWALSPGI